MHLTAHKVQFHCSLLWTDSIIRLFLELFKIMPSKKHYLLRNEYLSDLGYNGYKNYRESEDWIKIRTRILNSNPKCILCSKSSQVVHHVKYHPDVLLGLRDEVLAPLCHKCHEIIEFTDKNKNSLGQANVKLFELARKTKLGKKWCSNYYSSCKEQKESGKKSKIGKMCNEIAKDNWNRIKENL
jgi:hypothetical protein